MSAPETLAIHRLVWRHGPEGELVVCRIHHNRVAVVEVAREQPHRQRMNNPLLNRPAQWARTIDGVEADIGQTLFGGRSQFHRHVARGQTLAQIA